MRLLRLLGFLSVLLGCATVQAQQRLALVMGNANYAKISQLKNAVNDAKDVAKTLGDLGFQVVVLKKDLNHQQMERAINAFGKQVKAGDIALFYYAGHGVQSSDAQNYLIPLGARINDESDLPYNAINANWVLSKLQLSQPALKIMILDACRDNPFRGFRSWRGSQSRGLARMKSRGGTIIAYAADEGQKASDGEGRNGLYTQELLKLLGQSGVQASQMFSNVSWQVSNDPSGKGQTPFLSMKAVPPFCFAGCATKPQPVVPEKPVVTASVAVKDTPTPVQRSFEPKMVKIRGGSFQMGSPASEKDHQSDETQHAVQVGDFWMASTETTVKQYLYCVTAGGCKNPEWLEKGSQYNIHTGSDQHYKKLGKALTGDHYPITGVSWGDATDYAIWLSKTTGKHYRLPTEAQWEYAARAGRKSAYPWGNVLGNNKANCNGCGSRWDNKSSAPVAQFSAYEGLYDMQGNVWEWTCSAYDKQYAGSESQCAKGNEKRSRVLRGGSWTNLPRYVRSAFRLYYTASSRNDSVGFRLSRTH